MPAYNSEKYIEESILSIQKQIYDNWELIIVDDCSTDSTVDKIQNIKDPRIKLIQFEVNSGAAKARNRAIEEAKGEYIAFLDSDDLWTEVKLLNQISFMQNNNYFFTSTQYAEMGQDNRIISIMNNFEELDYNGVLKFCPGNSTVIYNAKELGKFYIPDIRKRNDFAMWLQVIKKANILHGLKETNTIYRVREGSLSNNKTKLIKYQWKVYRDIENLSLFRSIYLLAHKVYSIKFNINRVEVD